MKEQSTGESIVISGQVGRFAIWCIRGSLMFSNGTTNRPSTAGAKARIVHQC